MKTKKLIVPILAVAAAFFVPQWSLNTANGAQEVSSYDGWNSATTEINWLSDLEAAKKIAANQNKFVLMHFTADWCMPCKALETFVFSSAGVQTVMNEAIVAVKIDADEQEALVSEFGVTQVPFDIVMTPAGRVILKRRSPADARNYTHMINSLKSANKDLDAGSAGPEASIANQLDYLKSHIEGKAQQASFTPVHPSPSQMGISKDSAYLTQQAIAHSPEFKGVVQQNPYADANAYSGGNGMGGSMQTPSANSAWQDREAMERKAFIERQRFLAGRTNTASSRPKPQRIINERFFDEVTTIDRPTKQLDKPEVSEMFTPGQANAPQTADRATNGSFDSLAGQSSDPSSFKMPVDLRGQTAPSRPTFVGVEGSANALLDNSQSSNDQPSPAMAESPSNSQVAAQVNPVPAAIDKSAFCLKGKCPVTLLKEGRWVDGDQQFGIVHRDRTYIFANAECLAEFRNNPDGYSPILAGYDPVVYHDSGVLEDGLAEHGVFMGSLPNQRVVLFNSTESRAKFQKDPHAYLDAVRQAMTKADGNGQMIR